MKLGSQAKVWLNRLGMALGITGVVFVLQRLYSYGHQLDAASIGTAGYAAIAGLAFVYGASNLLLARGWWHLLTWLGVDTEWRWALRTFAVSQLAKYLPGNIFHFAGRQAMGVSAGIANGPLAESTLMELGMLIGGGALFVPLAAPLATKWFDLPAPPTNVNLMALAAFAAVSFIAIALLGRLAGRGLWPAALSYFIFLALSGVVFVGCFEVAGGRAEIAQLPAVAGAYVIAWLVGLVTPGAPAGLGVREAVLLFLLGGLAASPVILLAVVIGRAVTVLGDLGFWAAGGFVARRGG